MRVFWDTNLFICLIGRHPVFYPRVLAMHEALGARGAVVVTSALTLGELIAQPLRCGRADLVTAYSDLLMSGRGIELVSFDAGAAREYGRIRASSTVRQPDAIQLACAIAG